MKKLLILFSLLFILGCAKDEDFIIVDTNQEVPKALVIKDLIGYPTVLIMICLLQWMMK